MKHAKLFCAPLAVAFLMAGQLFAQAGGNLKDDAKIEPKTVSVTGCLAQTEGPGVPKQFIIKVGDQTYELEAGDENLNAHLGHKVTVSGTSLKGKGPHNDDRIHVMKLTMVSVMCS
jgi:hypothetical protein